MSVTVFAFLEGALLVLGALVAARLTASIARKVDRNVLLMAAVAVWFILVAMVPFLSFALLVDRVPVQPGGIDALASFILNTIPFALIAAPFIGFIQGLVLSMSKPTSAP